MRRSQMTEFKKAMKSEDFEIKTKICKKPYKGDSMGVCSNKKDSPKTLKKT